MNILFLLAILFPPASQARDVEFSWDPVEKASKYDIQVSESTNFDKTVLSVQSDKPMISAPLGVGHYYYRVRVVDLKARAGKWSQPAPVTVAPYAPQLLEPQPSYEVSYFEVLPELEFIWKPSDGKLEYEILISKSTGEKVLEETVAETKFKTKKLPEGEYNWKIRCVVQKAFMSEYSDSRKFIIKKNSFAAPKLITPSKNGLVAAYRPVDFTWEQDPNSHFTDLAFEKVSGRFGAKPFKEVIANIADSSYRADYEEPGAYRWSIITKEAKDSTGIESETWDFEVRDDVIHGGNYELEFSLSPTNDLYTTTSARQTSGITQIAQQTSAAGNFLGFLGGYYIFETFGIFINTRTGLMNVEGVSAYSQVSDATMRLRFGSKGFSQEFWFGYRMMDIVEAENQLASRVTDFTTFGPLIGTRFTATIKAGLKAQLNLLYYKPMSSVEGISGYTADVYEGAVGLKWNFMYQFWLGYRFSSTRINGTFITPGANEAENASWTMYRLEPVFLSLSFEH